MPDAIQNFDYTDNRELSWLKFNRRVLEIARDARLPAIERLRFISIFTSNLDEFCMIRVGSIHAASQMKKLSTEDKTGMTAQRQLDAIYSALPADYERRDELFRDVECELRSRGIYCLSMRELDHKERKFAEGYFKSNVQPLLSPQVVDSRHPFPHLENKELYIALAMRDKDSSERVYGMVSVPKLTQRLVVIPGSTKYIPIERLILEFSDLLFKRCETLEKGIFSVTRNADIQAEDDDDAADVSRDFRGVMQKLLKKRGRLAPVRLEREFGAGPIVTEFIAKNLSLTEKQVFVSMSPLTYGYIDRLPELLPQATLRNLVNTTHVPARPAEIDPKLPMLRQVLKKDILLSFPYEEMDGFLRMLREAAQDPDVISIDITIYRLGRTSRLVEFLKMAAENGKQVTALMELRARFDEANNIEWANELERAGCHVIYGVAGYKVHSKICLITRRERGRISYITQIGTGNYNESTGKIYADFSLMTADPSIGADAVAFFRNLNTADLGGEYNRLLVSPKGLLPSIVGLIDREAEKARSGGQGRIIMKMNSLTDREVIDKLSEASCAGVQIDLIVRGICCLIPGVEGRTENVSVTSIVGRFLEHARVYIFGVGNDELMYISSADMMERNIRNRVEIACPINDPSVKRKILHTIELQLKDNSGAYRLAPDGRYQKLCPDSGCDEISSQRIQAEEAHGGKRSAKKRGLFARLFGRRE